MLFYFVHSFSFEDERKNMMHHAQRAIERIKGKLQEYQEVIMLNSEI